MTRDEVVKMINEARTSLGIELGTTKAKVVLLGDNFEILMTGEASWESYLKDGIWTYSLDEAEKTLKAAYADFAARLLEKYGVVLERVGSLGISGMMHGYLATDEDGKLLAPVRTWQNTNATEAARILSDYFDYNIPVRWGIAQLYQSIIENQEHVSKVAAINTLSGYLHWRLTGKRVLGIGDASGLFPIDSTVMDYDMRMIKAFDELSAKKGFTKSAYDVLPKVAVAGENAGYLTEEGARMIDPAGNLKSGIPLCPPEGDAPTGMVATDAVRVRTGNVSGGTSIFLMIVLEKKLSRRYDEVDLVTTPDGSPVVMVQCNNCTNDLNRWVSMFNGFAKAIGSDVGIGDIYKAVYASAEKGELDCGGTVVCNFLAGEPGVGIKKGVPFMVRDASRPFSFENLCRSLLYATIVSLKLERDILKGEDVVCERIIGHGGLFQNGDTAAKLLANALDAPICTMKTASVGGPFGMALLAAYLRKKDEYGSFPDFLDNGAFREWEVTESVPVKEEVEAFEKYAEGFKKLLEAEKLMAEGI